MKAWIITWDWVGDAAAVVDRVAGILDSRKSPKHVAEIVEFLYAQCTANLGELSAYARNRRSNPYRAEIDFNGRIRCGRHPYLLAEVVDELKITSDPNTGIETISWVTLPVYTPSERGPKIITPPMADGFTRLITGPISHELMWDRSLGRFKDKFYSRMHEQRQ